MDFHTHNLHAPAGEAIINMPAEWTENPNLFHPRANALYSAGVHPWWTDDMERTERMLERLPKLLRHPQVVAVGECGLDRVKGAALPIQERVFRQQIAMAEELRLPVTLHIVRAYDALLHLHKELRPTTQWTVHGFRGNPLLAQQLLAAGLNLSFGEKYNRTSFELTPPDRRRLESD